MDSEIDTVNYASSSSDDMEEEEEEEEDSSSDSEASLPLDRNEKTKASPSCDATKVCGVCGDRALGNNFNAITCESCKAFFRRNALRKKEFVCPFQNVCKVDAITRRFCQRCRLKKCFDIGMKKEWIMTDEEKRVKKQKIEDNRRKRSSVDNAGSKSATDSQSEEPAAKVRITEDQVGTSGSKSKTSKSTALNDNKVTGAPKRRSSNIKSKSSKRKKRKRHHNQKRSEISTATNQRHSKTKESSVIPITAVKRATSPIVELLPKASTPPPRIPLDQLQPKSTQQSFHQNNNIKQDSSQTPWTNGWDGYSSSSNGSTTSMTIATPSPSPRCSPEFPYAIDPAVLRERIPPFSTYNIPRGEVIPWEASGSGMVDEHSAVHHPTPLLSSLIRPGYPESSPDPDIACSPQTAKMSSGKVGEATECDETSQLKSELPEQNNPINWRARFMDSEEFRTTQDYLTMLAMYKAEQSFLNATGGSDNEPPLQMRQLFRYTDRIERMHNELPNPAPLSLQDHIQAGPEQEVPLPLNTMDSILSVAISAEFNAFGILGSPIYSKELNKREEAKLNELLSASQALHAPVDADRPIKEPDTSDPSLLNVINLTEIAIRRLIKMSKKISGFKNMCQEDQIALLKGGCTEMMILRSVVTYDPDRDSWQIPHSNPGYNINLGVLKAARGNLYEEHQRFSKSFKSEWRKDENIMIILCAISLFTPERPNVVHTDAVKLEQDSYYYLLKRYLESKFNGCEAKSTYIQLIRRIAELRILNSSHVRVFLEMNPREVEPLLIEIFDMK